MKEMFRSHKSEMPVFGFVFFAAVLIVLFHLLFHQIRIIGMDTSIFYMDEKYTLASFFSTVMAFLVGFLVLTEATKIKLKSNRLVNVVYGLFFIGLSFDEYFEIHEYANTLIKSALREETVFSVLSNISWIFPLFLVIVIVILLFFTKWHQANKTARWPMQIGMMCFGAVLIFELLGSVSYGKSIYLYFVAIEEGLEMIGVTFFLLATLVETRKSL